MKCALAIGLFFVVLAGPALAQDRPWQFVVFGDTRGTSSTDPINTTILPELARATTNLVPKPAFVLVPGDLVYSGSLSLFQNWTNIMAPVYNAGIAVFPVMGNHDIASVSGFTTVFGPVIPDNGPAAELNRTYALTWSNVLVLALDTYVVAHQVNTNWIKSALNNNSALHIFAMGHEPAFSVNHVDCLDDFTSVRDPFWSILSNAACRVYFCGHDHFFDHMRLDDQDGNPSNDVHQYITGGGGAPLYADSAYDGSNGIWTPTRILHDMNYGFVTVQIDGPVATLTYYHRTTPGTYVPTSDVFTYSLAPVITSTYVGGVLTLSWSGGGILQSAPDLTGPWSNIPNAASPHTITDITPPSRCYRVQLRPASF